LPAQIEIESQIVNEKNVVHLINQTNKNKY